MFKKIADYNQSVEQYTDQLKYRKTELQNNSKSKTGFNLKMQRFLPAEIVKTTVNNHQFWEYLCSTVIQEGKRVIDNLSKGESAGTNFRCSLKYVSSVVETEPIVKFRLIPSLHHS